MEPNIPSTPGRAILCPFHVAKNIAIPYALSTKANFSANFEGLWVELRFEHASDFSFIANSLFSKKVKYRTL